MRKITAFYAWQSDTRERFNRHLIQIALRDAAKRITDSMPDVELILDYDTAGVPGTPPISDTILKKIAVCDIFIPDVSFVARTSAGKFVPNPNVMTEYGYALCAKTHAAMMPVMNTVFGPPQELPFDMGHLRHPIQYNVDPTAKPAQRRAVRRVLSQEFEEKLRLQIVATEPPRPALAPFPKAEPKDGPARFRAPGESIGIRWDPILQLTGKAANSVALAIGPAMWFRLMPSVDPRRKWAADELKKYACDTSGIALPPLAMGNLFTLRAEDGFAWCSLATSDACETTSVAFAFETGEVWAVDTWFLAAAPGHLLGVEIEQAFTRSLHAYARFLGSLGMTPPYQWIAGIIGAKHRRLQFPPPEGQMRNPMWGEDECLSEQISTEGSYDSRQTPTSALLPFFNAIFAKCGVSRPDYLSR
jgi:hypothetical protein